MPRAEIPEGVERFALVTNRQRHREEMETDPQGTYISVADLTKLYAHWLEQLKEELLSDAVIDVIAEQNAIRELYGHWEDFPAREANQRRRYAQLAKKPGVQESWKANARRDVERFLATVAFIPIEEGGDE